MLLRPGLVGRQTLRRVTGAPPPTPTFPIIDSVNDAAFNFAASYTLQSSIAVADRQAILIMLARDGNSMPTFTLTGDTDWTLLGDSAQSNNSLLIYYWINTTGSTQNKSMAVTLSASDAILRRRIFISPTNPAFTINFAISDFSNIATGQPDPPSLDALVSRDHYWLAVASCQGSGSQAVTSYPTNYTLNQTYGQTGASSDAATLASAGRTLTAQTEDPPAFTMVTTTGASSAATIAIWEA